MNIRKSKQTGTAVVEYAFLLGLVAVAMAALAQDIEDSMTTLVSSITTDLGNINSAVALNAVDISSGGGGTT